MAGWFSNTIKTIGDTANRISDSIPEGVKNVGGKVLDTVGTAVTTILQPPSDGFPGCAAVPFTGNISKMVKEQDSANYVSLGRNNVSNTVGRFSYELDKYNKNAMLIFHVSSYSGSYETVDEITAAFEKFRFEVQVYHDLNGDQVRTACAEFFSRDFTSYGAVAVVVVAPPGAVAGQYRCPETSFTNDDILKYYWDMTPSSLKTKPKIFISQGDNQIMDECNCRPSNLYSEERHVYELYLPSTLYEKPFVSHNRICRPLIFICCKLDILGDQCSFQDIVLKAVSEIKKQWPCLDQEGLVPFDPTTFNIMKTLIFWRTPNQ